MKHGTSAYKHMKALSVEIGQRASGTEGSDRAKDYIYKQFKELGFDTHIQNFEFTEKDKTIKSANIIAIKPGKSTGQVIVGSHYDSVNIGKGADDSASGVGVLLEAAEVLKNEPTPYTIIFIAFGAEENRWQGSLHYVSQMSEEEIKNTIGMINLDSLGVGDTMYVHGSPGEAGWMRDLALAIAQKHKLNMETNPGLNPKYPEGTCGNWGDHASFTAKGIPYAYFESTNWRLGDLDGYTQTAKDGGIWHTEKDTMEYIERNYPERLQEHLSAFSVVLTELLKSMDNRQA